MAPAPADKLGECIIGAPMIRARSAESELAKCRFPLQPIQFKRVKPGQGYTMKRSSEKSALPPEIHALARLQVLFQPVSTEEQIAIKADHRNHQADTQLQKGPDTRAFLLCGAQRRSPGGTVRVVPKSVKAQLRKGLDYGDSAFHSPHPAMHLVLRHGSSGACNRPRAAASCHPARQRRGADVLQRPRTIRSISTC